MNLMFARPIQKFLALFLITFLVLLLQTNIQAQEIPFKDYKIYVDDKLLPSDHAPMILSGRTLIPVRAISEAIGATVTWNPKYQIATIQHLEDIVELAVNLNRAQVNRKSIPLDVPAQLLNGRMYVPLRFIGEALHMQVDFEPSEKRIRLTPNQRRLLQRFDGVETYVERTKNIVHILFKGVDQYVHTTLQSPNDSTVRLVFDLPNTYTINPPFSKTYDNYPLLSIRYNPLDEAISTNLKLPKETVRVVIDLAKNVNYALFSKNDTLDLHFQLQTPPKNYRFPSINRGLPSNSNTGLTETIDSSMEPNKKLSTGLESILERSDYDLIKQKMIQKSFPGFDYEISGDLIRFTFHDTQLMEDKKNPTPLFTANTTASGNSHQITFENAYASLQKGTYLIQDDFIEYIKIEKNNSHSTIKFRTKEPFIYHVFTQESSNKSTVTLLKQTDIHQKWVVIDPGHGGSETGASYGGILEKTLNTDISIRLKQELDKRGISNYLLRANDTSLDLYERTGIANQLKSKLFLSIHNNAYLSSTRGTETLYYPSNSAYNNGYTFASLIQKHLIENLGTLNRGLVARPNLVVLRETTMPAALAEIAFMTNPTDLSLLKNPDFRQRAAVAMANAIEAASKDF